MNLGSSGMNQYKSIMFAGGCFWCMAKPYYEYDGVISVFSGYAGGLEVNPTYEEVKAHKTTHRETIKIVYDPNVISYDELLFILIPLILLMVKDSLLIVVLIILVLYLLALKKKKIKLEKDYKN